MAQEPQVTDTPKQVAKKAGLRYVDNTSPGYSRKRSGKGFIYFDTQGKRINDKEVIDRIDSIGIPPAYAEVWICPFDNGHIQAIGLDERGRKQYRYHGDWQVARTENKYQRMQEFGQALPKIRRQVAKDLQLPGLPREKVIATIIDLLEKTLIRVGNEEYAKENKSYGLTTMQNKHVEVEHGEITFAFKGKSNQFHEISLKDKKLAKIVKQLQDLPGQDLFQYIDEDDNLQEIHSDDINEYLQEVTGQEFTAKDFRTWRGTVLAAAALLKCPECKTQTEMKQYLKEAVTTVAEELGNTPTVCRKAYIHPKLIESFTKNMHLNELRSYGAGELNKFKDLRKDEATIMVWLAEVG